jgi:hypothetical protein
MHNWGFGLNRTCSALGVSEEEMRIMQPATILLMASLVAFTVACATPRKQPTPYDECMSLCADEVTDCVRSCYRWKWETKKVMDCVTKCNQKSAECQKRCSKLKEPISPRVPSHHDQGGDSG